MTYHYKTLGLASVAALAVGALLTASAGTATAATMASGSVGGFGWTATLGNKSFDFTPPRAPDEIDPAMGNAGPFTGALTNTRVSPWSEQANSSAHDRAGSDTTNPYYAVIPNNPDSDSPDSVNSVSYNVTNNSFRFLWGSVDIYNDVWFNGDENLKFSGADLGTEFGIVEGGPNTANGNLNFNAVVTFFGDDDALTKVTLASTSNAFEHVVTPIPLPASALLLLGGLGGLGGLSALRRRKRAA
jgi:hypothetical protein